MNLDEQYRRMMMEATGFDPLQKFRCWFGADIKSPYTTNSEENSLWIAGQLGKLLHTDSVVSDWNEATSWNPEKDTWGNYDIDDYVCANPFGDDGAAGVGFTGNITEVKKVLNWLKKNSNGLDFCRVSAQNVSMLGMAMLTSQWDFILASLDEYLNTDYAEETRNEFIKYLETNDASSLNELLGEQMVEYAVEGMSESGGPYLPDGLNWAYPAGVFFEGNDYEFSSIASRIKQLDKIAKTSEYYDVEKGWKKFGKYITKNIPCNFPKLDVFRYILITGKDISDEELEFVRDSLVGSGVESKDKKDKTKEIPALAHRKPEMSEPELRDNHTEKDINNSHLSESIQRMKHLAGILKG